MGGDTVSPVISSLEEESSSEQEFPEVSLELPTYLRTDGLGTRVENDEMNGKTGKFDDVGHRVSWDSLDFEADRRRKRSDYREILHSYDEMRRRSENLEEGQEAKIKILSYTPGAWIEKVGGMSLIDYNVPQTTSLLLIGPRGAGKSSLVNRISRVFEVDKFAPERAQVSYNLSTGDGTLFLKEYMIPRDSTTFCLYDTRSLCNDSSENFEMLKRWMTKGVRHGEVVIRNSDSSSLKTRMKWKARQSGHCSSETRTVNFVIFVVDGLSVLKSMNGNEEAERQYTQMIATTFNYPFLSFRDDKPVIVVTHGDLLSLADRARVRIHLGELLGISSTKQIFDIPENCDPATELAVVDMLRYSLEHADGNLRGEDWSGVVKVCQVYLPACLFMLIILGIAIISAHIHGYRIHNGHMDRSSESNPHIDWRGMRHLWLGEDYD